MKKLFLSFLPLLLLLVSGFAAQAQFTTTVTWGEPGAVKVLKGDPYSAATEVELPAGATEVTLTEAAGYFFEGVDGWVITKASLDGVSQALTSRVFGEAKELFNMRAQYPGIAGNFNGKTVELALDKYAGSFVVQVNGAVAFYTSELLDADGANVGDAAIKNNTESTVKYFSNAKTYKFAIATAPYQVSVNDTPVTGVLNESTQKTEYLIPVANDMKVVIDINEPKPAVKLTFEFTNNNPECINTIFNWTTGTWLDLTKLTEGYEIADGSQIQINMIEDCTVNSITANGASYTAGTKYTIDGDTKFALNVTSTTYTPLSATVYSNMIEGVKFSNSPLDTTTGNITVTTVGQKPAGTTLPSGYAMSEASTEYTLGNISGKYAKVFFEIQPGYYLYDGVLGNPEDAYAAYLTGTTAFAQSEAPVYFNIGKVNFDTPARVYYDGPANMARLRAKFQPLHGSAETAAYGGQSAGEYIANGWTDITIDPIYDSYFEISLTVDNVTGDYSKVVMLDGVALTPGEEGFVYSGVIKKNSVLQIFFTEKAPEAKTIAFITAGDAKASVSCDGTTTTDLSTAITTYSSSEVVITPEAGTKVFVDGKEASLTNGKYSFIPTSSFTGVQLVKEGFGTLAYTSTPAQGATIKQLSAVELKLSMSNFEEGSSFLPAENAYKFITVSNGAKVSSIEVGDPDEAGIPLTIPLSTPITAAGEYTVTIPAGVVYETIPNASWDEYSRTAASRVNPDIKLTVTVDPAYSYKWEFTPEAGSTNVQPDDNVFIVLNLPEAKTLSEEAYSAAAGPWLTYNGSPIAKSDDLDSEIGWTFIQTMATWGKPALCIEISKEIFNEAGKLSIIADEGAFTVNGNEASPAIQYTAVFGDLKTYSYGFTPAEGTEIGDWQEFKLTFPEASKIAYNEDEAYIFIRQGWNWVSQDIDVAVEGNTATLTVYSEDAPSNGVLTLAVAAGSFILDDTTSSEEIMATWNYVRSTPVNFGWTADPEKNYINEGYGIYLALIYDEVETVNMGDNFDQIVVKLNDKVLGGYNYADDETLGVEVICEGYNILMINVMGGEANDPALTGTVSVSIPAGALSISGQPNPEAIEFTWNIIAKKEYTMTATPASESTVKELSEITLEFPDAETVGLSEHFVIQYFGVWDWNNFKMIANATGIEEVAGAGHPTFKVSFDPITEAGNYRITMMDGIFVFDGLQENEFSELFYTVDPDYTGVEDVISDADSFTVYNLQGILVLSEATADDVKALPAGIYIVNGSKVAVK